MKKLIKLLKRPFCKHTYEMIFSYPFMHTPDEKLESYHCIECGKTITASFKLRGK